MNHLLSPFVKLRELSTGRCVIHVADDSFLPGGTKQRAAVPFLQDLQQAGYQRFSYASPPAGFAQIALAKSCQSVGAQCKLYATAQDGRMSTFTESVSNIADVVLCKTLAEAEQTAERDKTAFQIPLGFDHPGYNRHLRRTLKIQWSYIKSSLTPKRLWLPVGSGTLYRAFHSIVDCEIMAVDVRVLDGSDSRIADIPRIQASELFRDPCEIKPPIQSNAWYDAKLWRFILEFGQAGDLWWNVAR